MHLHARDPNVIPCMCSPRAPRLTALPEGGRGPTVFPSCAEAPPYHPDIPRPIVNTTTSALLFFATIGLGMELTHPPDLTQDDVFVSCFSFSLNGMKSTE